ncbi:uncharacterized protein LOC126790917 [Argentina anserina]|uniref:uncharacterized protein LOC126790917 n=1 Tax=Argentina anserina TaxID=57926 RepID=UPI0021764087|nr:uncharacterized protein LOC126790917 [Potentilla anserina]
MAQDSHQLRLQNLEQQRRERTMCRLRDAVLSRAAAAGRSGNINVAAVERRIQELIPSFHTPTHPPYASMIQRAIEELNEEGGGVSEVAISEFIKREYEGLAWAHEGMVRVHLKKQCEMGVLVLEGGRYSFNLVKYGGDGGYVDVETESRRKRRPEQGRRGRGRWRGKEEGKVNDEAFEGEEIEGGDGQNVVMGQAERPNMDEVENASPAYIKLQNRGEAKIGEMTEEQVQAELGEDEVVKDNNQRESGEEPQPQHNQQQRKWQQEGQEKRRPGRPKSNKVMELVPYVPEEQPLRRRGRSKAKSDMDLGTIAEVPCDIEPLNEQPQRRQGRSKAKDDMEANATSEVPCALEHPQSEQPLKRRGPGRPPKTNPDSQASLTVLSISDIQHHCKSKQQQPVSQATKMGFSKPKRGRGRPRTLRN